MWNTFAQRIRLCRVALSHDNRRSTASPRWRTACDLHCSPTSVAVIILIVVILTLRSSALSSSSLFVVRFRFTSLLKVPTQHTTGVIPRRRRQRDDVSTLAKDCEALLVNASRGALPPLHPCRSRHSPLLRPLPVRPALRPDGGRVGCATVPSSPGWAAEGQRREGRVPHKAWAPSAQTQCARRNQALHILLSFPLLHSSSCTDCSSPPSPLLSSLLSCASLSQHAYHRCVSARGARRE